MEFYAFVLRRTAWTGEQRLMAGHTSRTFRQCRPRVQWPALAFCERLLPYGTATLDVTQSSWNSVMFRVSSSWNWSLVEAPRLCGIKTFWGLVLW